MDLKIDRKKVSEGASAVSEYKATTKRLKIIIQYATIRIFNPDGLYAICVGANRFAKNEKPFVVIKLFDFGTDQDDNRYKNFLITLTERATGKRQKAPQIEIDGYTGIITEDVFNSVWTSSPYEFAMTLIAIEEKYAAEHGITHVPILREYFFRECKIMPFMKLNVFLQKCNKLFKK